MTALQAWARRRRAGSGPVRRSSVVEGALIAGQGGGKRSLSTAMTVTEQISEREGRGQDLFPEVGQAHPVPALATDQELPPQIALQVLELHGHRGR